MPAEEPWPDFTVFLSVTTHGPWPERCSRERVILLTPSPSNTAFNRQPPGKEKNPTTLGVLIPFRSSARLFRVSHPPGWQGPADILDHGWPLRPGSQRPSPPARPPQYLLTGLQQHPLPFPALLKQFSQEPFPLATRRPASRHQESWTKSAFAARVTPSPRAPAPGPSRSASTGALSPGTGHSPWPPIDAFNKSDASEQSESKEPRSSPGPSRGTFFHSPLPAQDPSAARVSLPLAS